MINLSWTLQKLVDFTVNQKSNSSYFLIFDNIGSEDIKREGTIKRRSADLISMNSNNSTSSNATALINLAKSSAAFKTFIVILLLLIIAALVFLAFYYYKRIREQRRRQQLSIVCDYDHLVDQDWEEVNVSFSNTRVVTMTSDDPMINA